MATTRLGICTTCNSNANCTFNPKSITKWDCNEYDACRGEIVTVNKKEIFHKEQPWKTFKGLCGSCSLQQKCSWYRNDAVIFHCEHYQ